MDCSVVVVAAAAVVVMVKVLGVVVVVVAATAAAAIAVGKANHRIVTVQVGVQATNSGGGLLAWHTE